MVQDPSIQNQQRALESRSQSGPSSRRRPQLLNSKAEPIAPLHSSSQRPTRGPAPSKLLRPGTLRHFWIPGTTSPRGPSPWRLTNRTPQGGVVPSSARCTTSVRSSMTPKQGTWKCISYSIHLSLHPGSCTITSKLTRFRW
jgi:hypothetical protein